MPRFLPAAARTSLEAPSSADAFLVLAAILDSDRTVLLRVAANNEAIISRGMTFTAYPFGLALPNEDDQQQPVATVTIDNVDPAILLTLRGLDEPPQMLLEVVRAADPDAVLMATPLMTLRGLDITPAAITGKLSPDNSYFLEYPAASYTPQAWPGLFP